MADVRYLEAGPYRLDLRDERLWRDGEPVRLGGKSLALLRALMEQPQLLLTKDMLFETVWPGLAVSEAVLTTAMKELRRALGDDARAPTLIETVHGRGYRFLLPVERKPGESGPPGLADDAGEAAASPAPPHWGRPAVLAIAALVLVVVGLTAGRFWPGAGGSRIEISASDAKSLAVLPFLDLSPDASERWFADGLGEELAVSLSRTPDLRVASRLSAARARAEGADLEQTARKLGVAHILEGTVRRAGGRVRVTVQLVRAHDGLQVWAETYDRADADVISIQEDIAFQIASALKTVLDPQKLRAMLEAGTRSVEAYEAFLQGRSFDQRQLKDGGLEHARAAGEAYDRARALDPNFAEAHWQAAQTWFGNATRVDAGARSSSLSQEEQLARYFERVDAAIRAARNEVERARYEAERASMQLRVREAHRLMTDYVRARPRDIDAWEDMADIAAYAGRRDWLIKAAERVHTLSLAEGDPRSRAITLTAMALELEDAAARARRHLADKPDVALTQYQAHRALIWAGEAQEARALLDRISASALPLENKLLAALRQACAERDIPTAMRLYRELDAKADIAGRWQAAQIAGDFAAAEEILRPLDTPQMLPTLLQFVIYPTFDPAAFPTLRARLDREGVTMQKPAPMPAGCQPALSLRGVKAARGS